MAPPLQAEARKSRTAARLAGLGLIVLTLVVFSPVLHCGFITAYDDELYVTDNAHVLSGLTPANITWALTTGFTGNWHPLTWLSLMLDARLFGPGPAGFHAVNLGLHVLNVVLLFAVLEGLTGSAWRSALVASVFAVHPLRVESVAWISERKDVLSAAWGLVAILAYMGYVRRPGLARHGAMVLAFGLSLAAKPMLVTLPCLFLLLDVWPLRRCLPPPPLWGRVAGTPAGWGVTPEGQTSELKPSIRRTLDQIPGFNNYYILILEKLPLLAMSAAAGVAAVVFRERENVMVSLQDLGWSARLGNAAVAYVRYVGKTLWPTRLAVLYPFPPSLAWPPPVVLGALVFLFAVTALVLWQLRPRPYLAVGWFWFVGTLAPVIGLVQNGVQSMADRYTYLPAVGLLIMAAWSLPAGPPGMLRGKTGVTLFAALWLGLLSVLGVTTRHQISYWRDSETLCRHTLEVTEHNYAIENALGYYLTSHGRIPEAIRLLDAAVNDNPRFQDARVNLGVALMDANRPDQALEQFSQARRIAPDDADVQNDLGVVLVRLRRLPEAVDHYRRAVALEPGNQQYHANLGRALLLRGEFAAGVAQLRLALELDPTSANAGAIRERIERLERQRGVVRPAQTRP